MGTERDCPFRSTDGKWEIFLNTYCIYRARAREHNNNYDAKINIKLYASARTHPLKFISMSASCVRTCIYIEDMLTKKVSECAVTFERIVFS